VVSGDFYVEFHLKNKNDGFEWAVVAVYGAAEDVNKAAYLSELVRICEYESTRCRGAPWRTIPSSPLVWLFYKKS
jgi:hypothetical protein